MEFLLLSLFGNKKCIAIEFFILVVQYFFISLKRAEFFGRFVSCIFTQENLLSPSSWEQSNDLSSRLQAK